MIYYEEIQDLYDGSWCTSIGEGFIENFVIILCDALWMKDWEEKKRGRNIVVKCI